VATSQGLSQSVTFIEDRTPNLPKKQQGKKEAHEQRGNL
jgi:hypothetical protein